jgi:hypothetical protein
MSRLQSFAYFGTVLLATALFGCTDESSGVSPLVNDGDAGPPPGSSNSGEEEEERICDPGATQICAGAAGCSGGQTCSADGLRWSSCDCGGPIGVGGEGGEGTSGVGGEGASGGGAGGDFSGVGGDDTGGTDETSGGAAGSSSASTGGTSGSTSSDAGGVGGGGSGGATATTGGAGGGGSGGTGGSTTAGGGTTGEAGTGGVANGGSGGVAGSSGSGGNPSAGAGGVGGTAGSGGSGGQLNCGVPGAGLELIPEPGTDADSGWISGTSNCVGIEGTIFGYTDELGSTISIVESDGRICVEGEATAVLNGNFLDYWGSVVAFELNHQEGVALAYDADAYGVTGFALQISGSNVPERLRVRYRDVSDEEFCVAVSGAGSYSVSLDATHPECWEPGDTSTPDPGEITRLEVHVVSENGGDIPFDFCIDNITAIQSDDGGEGGAGGSGAGGAGAGGAGAGGAGGGTSDSCVGSCGDFAPGGCACDGLCVDAGDCCEDFVDVCGETCAGNCGSFLNACACDELCEEAGDCCFDYVAECTF